MEINIVKIGNPSSFPFTGNTVAIKSVIGRIIEVQSAIESVLADADGQSVPKEKLAPLVHEIRKLTAGIDPALPWLVAG